MPHYKDQQNNLHWLDSREYEGLLPVGCQEVPENEAAAIREQQQQERLNARSYADKRQSEYPSIYDYIDGVVKNDSEQVSAYIAQCLAVKAKYPKP